MRVHSAAWRRLWLALMLAGLIPALLPLGAGLGLAMSVRTIDVREGPVWVIPIEGTIDMGLAEFVQRSIREAEESGAGLILLEVNTFGGRVDSATEILDAVVATRSPAVAYIPQRAWSAGALIALGADLIVMAPGASIGAAEPVPADPKAISALRAAFEGAAERRGRDPLVAAAMVDATVEREGLVTAGRILTLSAQQAIDVGFIDALAPDRLAALAAVGYEGREVVTRAPTWTERVVRFLSDPTISQILLTIGFLGLLAEVTSPGWGVPGIAGITALALFFGSRLLVGLLGLEVILLFVLGLGLLLLEAFVLPGFGIAGFLGLLAVGGSLYMSFPDPATALQAVAIMLVTGVVLLFVLFKYFPRTHAWERLVLRTQQEGESYRPVDDRSSLVGSTGKAFTPLRPAGAIEIEGERYDAVTEGGFVPIGSTVRVIKVEGTRIVVRVVSAKGD